MRSLRRRMQQRQIYFISYLQCNCDACVTLVDCKMSPVTPALLVCVRYCISFPIDLCFLCKDHCRSTCFLFLNFFSHVLSSISQSFSIPRPDYIHPPFLLFSAARRTTFAAFRTLGDVSDHLLLHRGASSEPFMWT